MGTKLGGAVWLVEDSFRLWCRLQRVLSVPIGGSRRTTRWNPGIEQWFGWMVMTQAMWC
jgi:hypothetical protein